MNPKLAIVAGKGDLPKMIIKKCQEQGREFIVILINGEPSNVDFLEYDHHIVGFSEVSRILNILKTNQIKELVFAGGVTKPSMSGIKADGKGAVLLTKILGNKFFGDDNLLSTIINFFEQEGFKVIGADKIIDDLLAQKGFMGNVKSDSAMQKDIEIGQTFSEENIGFSKDSSDFLHTEHVMLVDKTGRIRGVYNGTLILEMQQLAEDIRSLQNE